MSSNKPEVKQNQTFKLSLTKYELLHIRDLFSITLPPEAKKTISQALADLEQRSMVESMLWNKIVSMCIDAKLPVSNDAPDYVIAPTAPPPMAVFQLAPEPEALTAEKFSFLPDHKPVEESKNDKKKKKQKQ